MLENEMQIMILEEEKSELQKQVNELIKQNKQLIEELNYSRCNNNRSNIHTNSINTNRTHIHNLDVNLDVVEEDKYGKFLETDESDDLANAYDEAMNIDTIEEAI